MSSGGGKDPWAWLGLLKWSLSYTDGTRDSSFSAMSEEDRAFLEKVMKDGIIDENERMKTILKEVTDKMTEWKDGNRSFEEEKEEDSVNYLLQELRDIVEQIDYARAFTALKGLDFLLGCVQERNHVPKSTRALCLGILATLSSNNPPVQKQLLELGSLKTLCDLFFTEQDSGEDSDGMVRSRTVQAIGAIVRSHELGEAVFCQLPQAPALISAGLGMDKAYKETPQSVRQRTLFLFRALAISDLSTADSIRPFLSAIGWVADYVVDDTVEASAEIREMALFMLEQILEQKKFDNTVLDRKQALAGLGVRRIAALRMLTGEEREFTAFAELELWESILVLLARS